MCFWWFHHRRCSRLAELMRASLCSRLIASFMVLDSLCGWLHRAADIPLCVSHFECAPVFWLTMQRYNIFRAIPNFGHRFGAIFSTNLTNWCFQHRVCSRSAELMRAWLCTRLIAVFERTVIHDARIRNFRPSCITFRRFRARWALLPKNVSRHSG